MSHARTATLLAAGALLGGVCGWAAATLRTQNGMEKKAGGWMPTGGDGTMASTANLGKADASESSALAESQPGVMRPGSPGFERAVRGALRLPDATDRAVRLREIFRGVALADLPAAFGNARKLSGSEGWTVLSILGRRWAESDPRGALAYGMKLGVNGGSFFITGAIEKWTSVDPGAATKWIEALPAGTTRNDMMSDVIREIGRSDPQAALTLLKTSPAGDDWAAQQLFGEWAARDPQAAAAGTLELKGIATSGAFYAVASAWAKSDPARAMEWAASLPAASKRKEMMRSISQEWAEADPRSELAWARALDDASIRRDAMGNGITRLAVTDLPAAVEQLGAIPPGEDHDSAAESAAYRVAQEDARSGLKLLDLIPDGPNRSQALGRLCKIWGQSDPRAALDWQLQNTAPSKGGDAIQNTILRWMAGAPEDAMAWAQALPAGDSRDSALTAVVHSLAETDPARAQTVFARLTPEAQGTAAASLATAMVKGDIDQARTWAESLPTGAAQSKAFATVALHWASQDPKAAAEWLGTLPAGEGRDAAISRFSDVAFTRDPDAALAWALNIGDATERERQSENLLRQWLASDSTAARTWLDAHSEIADDEKQRILRAN